MNEKAHVIVQIDPMDFRVAWRVVSRIAPRKKEAERVLRDADGNEFRIRDNSLLRVLDAVRSVVNKNDDVTLALALRMVALMTLVQKRSLDSFINREGQRVLLPEFLLDIAATLPCGPSGFNKTVFLEAVKEHQRPKKLVLKTT
jgi:hypothetical protein